MPFEVGKTIVAFLPDNKMVNPILHIRKEESKELTFNPQKVHESLKADLERKTKRVTSKLP